MHAEKQNIENKEEELSTVYKVDFHFGFFPHSEALYCVIDSYQVKYA